MVPIADTAATLFYEDLFRRNPSLRALFKEDMADQRRKLMTMIGTAVANLGNWANIAPAVAALGQRHAAYGVKIEDYDTVGKALIATLEKGLGDAFTPEVKEAWLACYAAVAAEMVNGAQAVVAPGAFQAGTVTGTPVASEAMTASNAAVTSTSSDGVITNGVRCSTASANASTGRAQRIDARRRSPRCAGLPISATRKVSSSRASAAPLVPNTWTRQNGALARTVAIVPVAPEANVASTATASRGSGTGFARERLGIEEPDRPGERNQRIEHMQAAAGHAECGQFVRDRRASRRRRHGSNIRSRSVPRCGGCRRARRCRTTRASSRIEEKKRRL